MTSTRIAKTAAKTALVLAALLATAACANTIRGIGHDTANAVDATGAAVRDVTH